MACTLERCELRDVWLIVHRYGIGLTAGRETMGCRLSAGGGDRSGEQTRMPRKTELRSKPESAGQASGASRGMAAGHGAVRRNERLGA